MHSCGDRRIFSGACCIRVSRHKSWRTEQWITVTVSGEVRNDSQLRKRQTVTRSNEQTWPEGRQKSRGMCGRFPKGSLWPELKTEAPYRLRSQRPRQLVIPAHASMNEDAYELLWKWMRVLMTWEKRKDPDVKKTQYDICCGTEL